MLRHIYTVYHIYQIYTLFKYSIYVLRFYRCCIYILIYHISKRSTPSMKPTAGKSTPAEPGMLSSMMAAMLSGPSATICSSKQVRAISQAFSSL